MSKKLKDNLFSITAFALVFANIFVFRLLGNGSGAYWLVEVWLQHALPLVFITGLGFYWLKHKFDIKESLYQMDTKKLLEQGKINYFVRVYFTVFDFLLLIVIGLTIGVFVSYNLGMYSDSR